MNLRVIGQIKGPVSRKKLDVCVYFDEMGAGEAVYLYHKGRLHGKPFLFDPDFEEGGTLQRATNELVLLRLYSRPIAMPEDFPIQLVIVE